MFGLKTILAQNNLGSKLFLTRNFLVPKNLLTQYVFELNMFGIRFCGRNIICKHFFEHEILTKKISYVAETKMHLKMESNSGVCPTCF